MKRTTENDLTIKDAFDKVQNILDSHGNFNTKILEDCTPQLEFGYQSKQFKQYFEQKLKKKGKIGFFHLFLFSKKEAYRGMLYYFLSFVSQLVLPVVLEQLIKWMFDNDAPRLGSVIGIFYLAFLIILIILKDYFYNLGSFYLRLNSCILHNQIKVSEKRILIFSFFSFNTFFRLF